MDVLSARNRMKGKIVKIERDGLMGKIRVRIEEPFTITVVVTSEALEELEIKLGDIIEAIITATEVMIKRDRLEDF